MRLFVCVVLSISCFCLMLIILFNDLDNAAGSMLRYRRGILVVTHSTADERKQS